MKRLIPAFVGCLTLLLAHPDAAAQRIMNLPDFQPEMAYENIHVHKLDTDPLASTFVIWVKNSVKEHYHQDHTEIVYVMEGTGVMTLGEETREVKPGDYIFIPKGTHHSVKVTSTDPMKVLSVQTPEFDGSDRVFVTQE